jgi:hypothetical protein
VLKDGQVGFVVENLIKDIGGIAERGGDDFGAILGELIAAPTIEGNAFAIANNWLRVLGTAERSQVDQRIRQ